MRLSEGIPLKTCANPPARNQNINRANIYENLTGVIHANRFARFARIGPIGNSNDSWRIGLTRYENRGLNCKRFAGIESARVELRIGRATKMRTKRFEYIAI